MNMLLSLTVLGALYSVALSQGYDGRRPVPLPKPVPFPKPLPHPKPRPRCVKVGTCGGFAGATCPKGSTCRYRPNADFGDCCRITGKPFNPCRFGKDGICGGIGGLRCRPGTKCTSIGMEGIPDGNGVCCIIKPKKPTLGVCPPPSGLITTCQFDPKRNCLSDDTCPPGSRCCSEGCGKVCKRVLKG